MKKYLTIALLLTTDMSLAQEGRAHNHTIWCFEKKSVAEVLARDYKETAIFHGETETTHFVLYANEKTGGWTLIGYQGDLGCIMAAGKKHRQIFAPGI